MRALVIIALALWAACSSPQAEYSAAEHLMANWEFARKAADESLESCRLSREAAEDMLWLEWRKHQTVAGRKVAERERMEATGAELDRLPCNVEHRKAVDDERKASERLRDFCDSHLKDCAAAERVRASRR